MRQLHTFPPVYDAACTTLILGSFPSVRSRAEGFYYGHPRNRFWPMLAGIFDAHVPETIDEKRSLLLANHIALWDVCASCEITGSADSSITEVVPNDLSPILKAAKISLVLTNGKTADSLYRRHQLSLTGIDALCMPSTSPANAAVSLERLTEAWGKSLGQK
ncbi:MAG: DNA-deoxyinosine glycosylase [Clostridia bacterium]|nr:DNA-deoxyinosine glycosylase [Clostridia bacterium]